VPCFKQTSAQLVGQHLDNGFTEHSHRVSRNFACFARTGKQFTPPEVWIACRRYRPVLKPTQIVRIHRLLLTQWLEMICANFLAGVSVETGNQDVPLPFLTRLVLGLPKPQIRQLFENVQVTL
jgi:hypothetical protein